MFGWMKRRHANRRILIWAGLLGVSVNPATVATAQERADTIIQSRIANFREIGTAYKSIGDELKLRQPRLARIRESAQLISDRGANMLYWFPPGTEPSSQAPKSWLDTLLGWFSSEDSFALGSEAQSHAKRAIWTQRPKFEYAYGKFSTEAHEMWQAAQSGHADAISAQFKRLGESCKACHEVYREKVD